MKSRLVLSLLLPVGLLTAGAHAQGTAVATPATPAPAVAPAPAPAPSRIVYTPRLPSPNELISVAAAQGLAVDRIEQSANQIVVTYKDNAGQPTVVSYQLLATAANAPTVATPATPAPAVAVAPAAPVVYVEPYPYVYADPYYYPWPYYSPVAVSVGFGFYPGHVHFRGPARGHGPRRW